MDTLDFRTVLAYDKFHEGQISVFERMLIHQHINQKSELSNALKAKINTIHAKVRQQDWKKPETRYTNEKELEVFNTEVRKWECYDQARKESIYG